MMRLRQRLRCLSRRRHPGVALADVAIPDPTPGFYSPTYSSASRPGRDRRGESTRLSVKSFDDDLSRFEMDGAAPLPAGNEQGYVEHDGARIWYSTHGSGRPVILLHGGLGHSGNWGYQVPALLDAGYQAVLIDSRGHGRSTRDSRPFGYELMASDVLDVMDTLHLDTAALVGWSDGACTALVMAMTAPARTMGVFYFACNMDPSGAKQPIDDTLALTRCFHRHSEDYAQLSATPDQFREFVEAVGLMQRTQPNASAYDLAAIRVPVFIVHSQHDEFIRREHAEYLARTIPRAQLIILPDVSHFAPLQRPAQFNATLLDFLRRTSGA
jgi:pimeloyl-ACP methyl ester carboxylesterase